MSIERIKKLLALANHANTPENERESAQAMATALMTKLGIEAHQLKDDAPALILGDTVVINAKWQMDIGEAAATLSATKALFDTSFDSFQFLGRSDLTDMGLIMFGFLNEQVERLYKRDLPRGLSKQARAEFRKSYKEACSRKVLSRAIQWVENAKRNDNAAIGSTALVVQSHFEEQERMTDAALAKLGATAIEKRGPKLGNGTLQGTMAGNEVKLAQEVTNG